MFSVFTEEQRVQGGWSRASRHGSEKGGQRGNKETDPVGPQGQCKILAFILREMEMIVGP